MQPRFNWSLSRATHSKERLILRGISEEEFEDAVIKGPKKRQEKNIYEAIFRHFKAIFEQRIIIIDSQKIRKIYPITVKLRGD